MNAYDDDPKNKDLGKNILRVITEFKKLAESDLLVGDAGSPRRLALDKQSQFWLTAYREYENANEKFLQVLVRIEKNLLILGQKGMPKKFSMPVDVQDYVKSELRHSLSLHYQHDDIHRNVMRIKRFLRAVLAFSGNGTVSIHRELLLDIDELYFLRLSISEKLNFFTKSSDIFFDAAQSAIDESHSRNQMITAMAQGAAVALIVTTFALTIFFWHRFASIVRAFLASLSKAIAHTRSKQFQYPIPFLADEELQEVLKLYANPVRTAWP